MKIRNIAECLYSKGAAFMVVCCCSTITNSIHRVRQVNIHHHYHSLAPSRLPTRPPRPAWREPVRFSLVLAACAQPPHAPHPLQPPPPPARRLRWPHRPTTPSQQSPDPADGDLCPLTIPHYAPSSYPWSPRRCRYQVRALHSPMSPQCTPRAKLLGEGSYSQQLYV